MIISEYWNEGRKAIIRREKEGYEVDLYKENFKETRQVHDHSETYAENVAENYVEKVFDLEPNDFGYYGYNRKTDNYHPELD